MAEELQVEIEQEETAVIEQQEAEDQPNLSPTEQKAWDQGWRPEDQFEGNQDNWKTAGEYVLYGEFQDQLKDEKNRTRRKEQDFDQRIANLNKLHEQQQTAAINNLKAQQRTAVEEADTESYDRLQKEIEEHRPAVEDGQPVKDPDIAAWEEKNEWINDPNDEKTIQAQAFFNVAVARPNATTKSALKYVDDQMAKLHPETTNQRRDMPTMTETSRKTTPRKGRDLTMSELTAAEKEEYKQFGSSMFGSDKEFLKAVADARKE